MNQQQFGQQPGSDQATKAQTSWTSTGNNWSLAMPAMANSKPFDPTQERLTDGPKMGVIIDTGMHPPKEAGKSPSIALKCRITEQGPDAGRETTIYVGMPGTNNAADGKWHCILVGAGYQIQQMTVQTPINGQMLMGKPIYLFIKNPPEGEKDAQGRRPLADVSPITPTMYAQQKEKLAREAAQGGSGSAVQPPAFNPAGFNPTMGTATPDAQPPAFSAPGQQMTPQPNMTAAQSFTQVTGAPSAFPQAPAQPAASPFPGVPPAFGAQSGFPGAQPPQSPFPGAPPASPFPGR